MKKILILCTTFFILIAIGWIVYYSSGHQSGNFLNISETVKVGFSGPLTGPAAWAGELYLAGLERAQADINLSGGILGKRLELIVEDNKFSGRGGLDSFNALRSKGAQIILTQGTAPSVSMSPESLRRELPILVSATFVDIPSQNPYAVRVSIIPEIDVEATLIDMKANLISTVTVLYMNNEYGVSTLKEMQKQASKYGVNIVSVEAFMPESPDLKTSVLKVVERGAEAAYVIDLSYIRVMTELRQIMKSFTGKKEMAVYLPASAYSSNLVTSNQALFEGVHLTVPLVSVPGSAERISFINKLGLREDSIDALAHQAIGYDSLTITANILSKDNRIKDFGDVFEKIGSFDGYIGKFDINSRNIGVPLISAVFSDGKLVVNKN